MRVKGYPAGILYEYTVYVLQQHIQHVYVWGVGGRGRMCVCVHLVPGVCVPGVTRGWALASAC